MVHTVSALILIMGRQLFTNMFILVTEAVWSLKHGRISETGVGGSAFFTASAAFTVFPVIHLQKWLLVFEPSMVTKIENWKLTFRPTHVMLNRAKKGSWGFLFACDIRLQYMHVLLCCIIYCHAHHRLGKDTLQMNQPFQEKKKVCKNRYGSVNVFEKAKASYGFSHHWI